ncbi:MAG: class I SAM-dependent methyltransferase [Candidatus Omnitrophica bacterium]|nr:class I SAM-dependent methyltransferase [Candidatus Omnitrophota bacterium]
MEFGSGCSTLILAQALKDNKKGFLYSLEVSQHWREVTLESLPDELKAYCTVIHAPAVEIEYEGVLAFRHSNVPDVAPEFLYLDSPTLTQARRVAVDPLDLEERLEPGFFMVVDGRPANVIFLNKHLQKKYKFTHRPLFHNSSFELIG